MAYVSNRWVLNCTPCKNSKGDSECCRTLCLFEITTIVRKLGIDPKNAQIMAPMKAIKDDVSSIRIGVSLDTVFDELLISTVILFSSEALTSL